MAIVATATEVQNNFGKYLQEVQNGSEIIVLRKGKEAARLISVERKSSFLADSLRGVLHGDVDEKKMRGERVEEHERID